MFAEYAHIASFLSPGEGYGNFYGVDAMPEYLRPTFQPPQPWTTGRDKSGLIEDFIMIAEFSELEGPKPLMTIPMDGGGNNFDQNSFSVRILAVDHQTSTQGFSISEDAQVVLSDVDAGVFAFVHHLVLYDNTARGFVRPHCIAYVTSDQRKLMTCYENMSSQFKKVARCIKYGNLLVFVADLERHLKNLEHTKGFLLNQVSKQRLKETDVNSDMRKNADNELYRKLQSIRQSTSEIKEILSILKPLQSDKRLEARFRILEERAFHNTSRMGRDKLSLQEDWFNDLSSLDELDTRSGSLSEPQVCPLSLFKPRDYKPLLVETKKAKRFNAPLRGLHDLCSWGAKEGLRKLRCVHEYFKRDMAILKLEKLESKLMRPACTSIFHGQCVTGNLLSGIHIKEFSMGFDEEEDFSSLRHHSTWASNTSLDSSDSFKSVDSTSSPLAAHNASPSSGHTNDSLNGNSYQLAPSSLNINDISNSMEDEYYGEPNEKITGDEKSEETAELSCENADVKNENCRQSPNIDNKSQNEVRSSTDEIKRTIDMNDFDEAPIIIFKEHIKRPLSVVSLGCTDDESDSDQGALEGNTRANNCVSSNRLLNKGCEKKLNCVLNGKDNAKVIECEAREGKNIMSEDDTLMCKRNLEISQKEARCHSTHSNSSTSSNVFSNGEISSRSDSDSKPELLKENHLPNAYCNADEQSYSEVLIKANSIKQCFDSSTNSCYASDSLSQSPSSSPYNGVMNVPDDKTAPDNGPDGKTPSLVSEFSPISSSSSSTSLLEPMFIHQNKERHVQNNKDVNTDTSLDSEKYLSSQSSVSQENAPSSGIIERQYSAATSSIQSDFTDISIRELFPYLDSNRSMSQDVQSSCSACDTLEPTEGGENCSVGCRGYTNPPSWRPRHGLYTVGDWLNNVNKGRLGYGILEVLNNYSNLQHVVFSLMIGRPVLVVGVAKLEPEILKIINALTVFIPSTKRHQQYVLDWTSKPLRISDLSKLRLIGLCRPDRKSLDSFLPSAVKKASTVIDMEKKLVFAPQYQGQLIHSLLAKRKNLKSDVLMLSHIHWWLMDIIGKAFIFFHSFYLGSAGSMISSSNLREHRDSYRATVNGIMGRLGVKDSDCSIVEYLAELTKMSRLESSVPQSLESDKMSQPLSLHYTVCQAFKF